MRVTPSHTATGTHKYSPRLHRTGLEDNDQVKVSADAAVVFDAGTCRPENLSHVRASSISHLPPLTAFLSWWLYQANGEPSI